MDILAALRQEESKVREAGKCGAATVGHCASSDETLRWQGNGQEETVCL
jgi:hypothetical protein